MTTRGRARRTARRMQKASPMLLLVALVAAAIGVTLAGGPNR